MARLSILLGKRAFQCFTFICLSVLDFTFTPAGAFKSRLAGVAFAPKPGRQSQPDQPANPANISLVFYAILQARVKNPL